MESLFEDDTAQAKPILAEQWSKRSLGERFAEWRARLIEVFL